MWNTCRRHQVTATLAGSLTLPLPTAAWVGPASRRRGRRRASSDEHSPQHNDRQPGSAVATTANDEKRGASSAMRLGHDTLARKCRLWPPGSAPAATPSEHFLEGRRGALCTTPCWTARCRPSRGARPRPPPPRARWLPRRPAPRESAATARAARARAQL